MVFYKENNVFDETLERMNFIFDECDDIIVAMSGGKDSTVVFNLALKIAKERGRLPLKVMWLDQEAEWQATVDYMDKIMHMPEVEPHWYQVPFDFTNSLSNQDNFLKIWDVENKDKWVHPQSDISIKENPTNKKRFHDVINDIYPYVSPNSTHCGVIAGIRAQESHVRRVSLMFRKKSEYKGIFWCKAALKNTRTFYPIFDWELSDVWKSICDNNWDYNKVYDYQYIAGTPKTNMRVSSLIHETAWHNIEHLQEFEPKTYNRFINRINGVSTFKHLFDYGNIVPKELPFAFKDWLEYRDYLLDNIIKDEYVQLFKKRWKNQSGEPWYKIHVKELILNDIDGTINKNYKNAQHIKSKHGKYDDKYKNEMENANND